MNSGLIGCWAIVEGEIHVSLRPVIGILEGVAGRHLWSFTTARPLRRTYHAYDGGADVIGESQAVREPLSSRHRTWLSARPVAP